MRLNHKIIEGQLEGAIEAIPSQPYVRYVGYEATSLDGSETKTLAPRIDQGLGCQALLGRRVDLDLSGHQWIVTAQAEGYPGQIALERCPLELLPHEEIAARDSEVGIDTISIEDRLLAAWRTALNDPRYTRALWDGVAWSHEEPGGYAVTFGWDPTSPPSRRGGES